MKDTSKKSYKDFIYNNPRADKQTTDPAEVQADKEVEGKMLYDSRRMDTIRRMLAASKRRKREKKIDKLQSDSDHWKGLE
jgi:hypothetical protein